MRVLQINSVCGIRSTGRIAIDIAKQYTVEGHECMIAYGRSSVPEEYRDYSKRIGNDRGIFINAVKARLFDNEGFNAKTETRKFLEWADQYNPDVLWLHNLHGYYINIEQLFNWIKSRPNMKVKWTLHDCWAFTGHCSYFSYVRCQQWKDKCANCCQKKAYPKSILKTSSVDNYIRKKQAFTGVNKLELITPSNWLRELVRESFLNEYSIAVEHNKIDKNVFKFIKSDFKQKYDIQNKKMILGVATVWDKRKGLEDFIELSELLDNRYKIVLVGLTKKQIRKVPKNILCLPRTNCIDELVEIYSAADIFVNPSKEETFGLTTVEALACGTPAIVYKNTACEEVVNEYGGIAVEQNVLDIVNAIYKIEKHKICEFHAK